MPWTVSVSLLGALRESSGVIHKNHQIFIILNPIDLNIEDPVLSEPFRCEIEPKLGTCLSSGTIKCKIELDRGGKCHFVFGKFET